MVRCGLAGLLVAGFLFSSGCNPFLMPFYFAAPEPTFPAALKKLATEDKEKKITVAIVTWTDLSPSEGLLYADRDMNNYVAGALNKWVKQNKENVKVMHPRKVSEVLSANPEWKEMSPKDLRKLLDVDHLVYLEVKELELFEKGSIGQLFRGRCNIRVSLFSKSKGDEFEVEKSREVIHVYPRGGPQSRDLDTTISVFKEKFFKSVANQIAWNFTSHPRKENFASD